MKKINLSELSFEWKHADEVILHYTKPSNKQTYYEICKILFPMIILGIIFTALMVNNFIPVFIAVMLYVLFTVWSWLTIWYKLHRANSNYLFITSKRVLFHGMEWLFKDYVKKISYENIRNVNYFTDSILWKIFNYWALEIQSSHWWEWDIKVYHIENWKMLTHFIDKILHLSSEERKTFNEFDPEYFKNWK
jgi:hypothetical protein